jgi:hypothetical protein
LAFAVKFRPEIAAYFRGDISFWFGKWSNFFSAKSGLITSILPHLATLILAIVGDSLVGLDELWISQLLLPEYQESGDIVALHIMILYDYLKSLKRGLELSPIAVSAIVCQLTYYVGFWAAGTRIFKKVPVETCLDLILEYDPELQSLPSAFPENLRLQVKMRERFKARAAEAH